MILFYPNSGNLQREIQINVVLFSKQKNFKSIVY